jgi:hypothetical protein
MAKVLDVHKASLLAAGKWPDLLHAKDDLLKSGWKPITATRQVIRQFLGEEAAAMYGAPPKPRGRPKNPPKEKPPSAPCDVALIGRKVPLPAPKPEFLPPANPLPTFTSLDEIGGRKAAPSEWPVWVARKLAFPLGPIDDCPDEGAYATLLAVRSSPALAFEFWKIQLGKWSALKDAGPDKSVVDGTVQMDTIDAILEVGRAAMERTRGDAAAACGSLVRPEVAGSTPAPATNQEMAA